MSGGGGGGRGGGGGGGGAFYVSPTWINEFQLNLPKLTSYRTDQSSQHRELVSVQR